ncbi:MAG: hypothetical protein J4F35_22235 [Candidatus Latescibacteria bacterium]|nr:hypothetical protein [Candidatus Latescibacterota bacterium]
MRWLAMGLLALCWAGESWAGAWSQPRGGYYAKLSGIHYSTAEVFNDMGQRAAMGMDDNQFRARQVLAYGEYGLRERARGGWCLRIALSSASLGGWAMCISARSTNLPRAD